ncbi:signal peptide, CUB and EGF-like domain-containing protein 2 [Lampetra fluviatilis]
MWAAGDLDECALGTDECHPDAICRNTPGSYTCSCTPGHHGDGRHCQESDTCSLSAGGGCVHACTRTRASFRCSCLDGFRLADTGFDCLDVDECLSDNGGCDQLCLNSMGSYECSCWDGFHLSANLHTCTPAQPGASHTCTPAQPGVPGCVSGSHTCAHLCVNEMEPNVPCVCRPGHTLGPDFDSCIKTCAHGNGGCQHGCSDSERGPVCSCQARYTLHADGHSCVADSCTDGDGGDGGCVHQCGGGGACNCPQGFHQPPGANECQDVDECAVANGGCLGLCVNAPGSFACRCGTGFTLQPDQRSCHDVDECSLQLATCEHSCSNLPGGFLCSCRTGFALYGLTHCGDVDECAVEKGGCAHSCVNSQGSYACVCPPGMSLHWNLKDCVASCVVVSHREAHHGEACVLCPAVASHPDQPLDNSDCGVPCPAGSVSPDGFEPCTACPRGSHQREAGRVTCAPCGGRARRARPGQQWCFPCPQGSTTDSDGATSLTQCKGARCGGDLGDLVGELESPNYPGNYPVPTTCQWLVTAPPRHRLLLLLPEAELRPGDVACTDRLSIKSSREFVHRAMGSAPCNSRVWLELCSSRARPLVLNVPARRVWVDFTSGSTGTEAAEAEGATAAGFHVDYVAYHEEYEDLIQDIISDGHLYSFESHQQVLKNKKLVKTLFEVLANPHSYFKSTSRATAVARRRRRPTAESSTPAHRTSRWFAAAASAASGAAELSL